MVLCLIGNGHYAKFTVESDWLNNNKKINIFATNIDITCWEENEFFRIEQILGEKIYSRLKNSFQSIIFHP
jgi:hypothetical protein